MPQNFDIIGDVHGRASALEALLAKLGYGRRGTRWFHPEDRHLIFLGDLIDVGPQQRETLIAVRSLIDDGIAHAVMGNHEFNAICYATANEASPGEYLRSHGGSWGVNNRQQHAAFLKEFDPSSAEYREWIDWMLGLPLWIETDVLRVVHACWNQQAVERLTALLPERRLAQTQLGSASDDATTLGSDVSMLLKGPELPLPANMTFQDRSGHTRDQIRQAWWRTTARTYGEAALAPSGVELPDWDEQLPPELALPYIESKPTLFGHYCFLDGAAILGRRTACLDSCAARGHELTAYRWEGETELTVDHFICVPASPRSLEKL